MRSRTKVRCPDNPFCPCHVRFIFSCEGTRHSVGRTTDLYDFAEQLIRHTYDQQGGWIASAILQSVSNGSEILMFALPSALDGASAVDELKSVLKQKSVTAYVVAYDALLMGPVSEDAGTRQRRIRSRLYRARSRTFDGGSRRNAFCTCSWPRPAALREFAHSKSMSERGTRSANANEAVCVP